MKAMVCEMCSSNDIQKQDGVYVCQCCGTKYSVEEARKLMVDSSVDASGNTVQIDDTTKINNYLQLVQNAYTSGNYLEAETYCNKILELDSEHSDAHYYKGVSAAWQSTLARPRIEEFNAGYSNAIKYENDPDKLWLLGCKAHNDCCSLQLSLLDLKLKHLVKFPSESTCIEVHNYLKNILLAPMQIQLVYGQKFNQWKIGKTEYENQTPKSVSSDLDPIDVLITAKEMVLASALEIFNNFTTEYNNNEHPSTYEFDRLQGIGIVAVMLIEYIVPKDLSFLENDTDKELNLISRASTAVINMYTSLSNLKAYEVDFSGGYKSYNVVKRPNENYITQEIRRYHTVLNKIDPSHTIPDIPAQKTSSSGCYVATAIYGSYDCPEVWTLRRFRDYTLAETWYGRAFIYTYYAISPTLVKWFGKTKWFKNLWKPTLDRMVKKLNDNGVDSTAYNDREW